MRVGLFGARADDRGLGRITHDFYTHMRPDRTLVIDMGSWAHQFPQHLDRYPDATVVPFNGGAIDDDVMRRFFTGLHVAVMYETAYDHRAYDIARAVGCRTVLMAMPEFHRHLTEPHLPAPDVVWVPTAWRLGTFPTETRVVPVPVAAEQNPPARRGAADPLRVLHVGGHRTSGDRNGTLTFLRSLRIVTRPLSARVTTQDLRLPTVSGIRHLATFDVRCPANHWRLYDDADVLVMPRRYGGLCLPVQEAMAAGLGVAMTDCDPNPTTWPISPIPGRPGPTIRTPGGPVVLTAPGAGDVAAVLDRLAANPDEVDDLKARARQWAAANSWASLKPLYQTELDLAANPNEVAA